MYTCMYAYDPAPVRTTLPHRLYGTAYRAQSEPEILEAEILVSMWG